MIGVKEKEIDRLTYLRQYPLNSIKNTNCNELNELNFFVFLKLEKKGEIWMIVAY